jgi:hypothetical protein
MVAMKLRDAVASSLKNYHDLDTLETSPLVELLVTRLLSAGLSGVSSTIASRGLAVRQLLDMALEELQSAQPEAVALLRQRYCHDRSAAAMSKEQHRGVSTVHDHLKRAVSALTSVISEMEARAATESDERTRCLIAELPAPTYTDFIGHDSTLAEVCQALASGGPLHNSPVAVTGLGGLGKTSVVREALFRWISLYQPALEHVLWVTVVQSAGPPGMPSERRRSQTLEHVLHQLGDRLDEPLIALASNEKRLKALAERLARAPSVVVIDNVETPEEVSLALTLLDALSSVAQVLVTSRHRIDHPGVHPLYLRELTEQESASLLAAEARRLKHEPLDEDHMREVWRWVGGNPLALKLVMAQIAVLPLRQVLQGLQSHATTMETLMAHIYDTAWNLLSPMAQNLLLGMVALPLAGATWEGLCLATGAEASAAGSGAGMLQQAVDELDSLSLLQITRSLEPTYSLHRLTYRFLERKLGLHELPED